MNETAGRIRYMKNQIAANERHDDRIDVAIIGGGPAGLTAGLYAARGGAKTVLFEELFVGGQIAKTHQIDNMPGFPDGLEGYSVGALLQAQAEKFGLTVRYDGVSEVALTENEKRITLSSGETVSAKTVILCMGASPRKLGLAREDALVGSGVSYCATCDGAFFRDKAVAVVGGGDTALSDALYLARFCSAVTIVHRRDALRGAITLQEAAFAEEKITFCYSCVPVALVGEQTVEGLMVRNVKTDEQSTLPVSAVFAAVGVEPNNALVKDAVSLAQNGAVLTDARMKTSVNGVYAAGDLRDTPLRQVVTACADGALAATSALEFLAANQ